MSGTLSNFEDDPPILSSMGGMTLILPACLAVYKLSNQNRLTIWFKVHSGSGEAPEQGHYYPCYQSLSNSKFSEVESTVSVPAEARQHGCMVYSQSKPPVFQ